MSPAAKEAADSPWVDRMARAGLVSRAATYPQRARGLDGSLRTLAGQPSGPYLLGVMALGLACYGLYLLAEAGYRKVWRAPPVRRAARLPRPPAHLDGRGGPRERMHSPAAHSRRRAGC